MIFGPLEVLKDVTAHFDKMGIDYFLVGSLAAMYYSRPRYTNDIDLVIQIRASQIKNFEIEFDIDDYYYPPFEIIRDEVIRLGSFNLIHQASGIKIDIIVKKNTEHANTEFSRRKKTNLLPEIQVYLATPEDIIIKKLEYFREGGSEKHLLDIREIIAETDIDQSYLLGWIEQLDLAKQWNQI